MSPEPEAAPTTTRHGVRVVLRSYPLEVGERASEHYSEVVREFDLLVTAGDAAPGSVPDRVSRLVAKLQELREVTTGFDTARAAALERGEKTSELVLEVDDRVLSVCRQLEPLLDEVDSYSRDESVLTLPPSDEVVAYRRWYFGQIFDQVAGREPEPWPGTPSAGAVVRPPRG